MAESWVFLCLVTVFPICRLTNMMFCAYMADIWVNWRERDLGTLRAEIQTDQGVRRVLTRFGVLKFLENTLMRAGEPLLARIVSYWDPDHEVFIV